MPPGFETPLLLVGVVVLFYFLLIRPQQKRAKEQREKMDSLTEGDRVMTISGIIGTVRYLGEKQAILEVSPGVELTVVKGAISTQPVEDEFEYTDEGGVEAITDPESPEAPEVDAEPSDTAESTPASEDPETTK